MVWSFNQTPKLLSGLIPICASCEKIRDDRGYWSQVETYIATHSEAKFSHGICPDCIKTLYPEIYPEMFPNGHEPNGDRRRVAPLISAKLGDKDAQGMLVPVELCNIALAGEEKGAVSVTKQVTISLRRGQCR